MELAAAFGLMLDPWQQFVLEHSLRERPGGKWSAFEVGLMVSRQNGKGAILEARELAGLFLFGERLIIHSAHEFKTAKEAMRRLEFLLQQSGEPYKANRSHGEESLELKRTGARVMFQTRTKAGGLGLSGDLVIFDEAMFLASNAVQALLFTLSARPNPQLWYTGSAVDELIHPNSEAFTSIRNRGLAGDDPSLCYVEFSCEEGDDMADPTSWAKANPGQGYRVSSEHIAKEYRSLKHDLRAFGTQRLGIGHWPDISDGLNSEIPADKWEAMKGHPNLRGSPAIGIHRDRGTWVLTGAQYTDTGRAHIEIGYSRTASSTEVVTAVVELVSAWNPVAVAIKGRGDAAALEAELVKAGIEPEMVDGGRWSQWCGGFLNAALSSRLSHSDQDTLNDAAASAVKHELPAGGFIWDETAASSAALCAATLAHGALLEFGSERVRKPAGPVGEKSDQQNDELDVFTAF